MDFGKFVNTLTEFVYLYKKDGRSALVPITNIPIQVPADLDITQKERDFLESVKQYGVCVFVYDAMHSCDKGTWEFMFDMDIGTNHEGVPCNLYDITKEEDRFRAVCAELVIWYKETEERFVTAYKDTEDMFATVYQSKRDEPVRKMISHTPGTASHSKQDHPVRKTISHTPSTAPKNGADAKSTATENRSLPRPRLLVEMPCISNFARAAFPSVERFLNQNKKHQHT